MGWGGGVHVTTMSNSNAFAELRWVLTTVYSKLTCTFHVTFNKSKHLQGEHVFADVNIMNLICRKCFKSESI